MVDAVLSFGSNLGDRKQNIITAVTKMGAGGLTLRAVSSLYETKPIGVSHHPDYYNAVAVYQVPPGSFNRSVALLTGIENDMGRQRQPGTVLPRPIDIDVIFWGTESIHDGSWIVPHPKFRQRWFVLKPLVEIGWGDFIDPVSGKTISALLAATQANRQQITVISALEIT